MLSKKFKISDELNRTANQNNTTGDHSEKKDFGKIVLKSSFFASILILFNSKATKL